MKSKTVKNQYFEAALPDDASTRKTRLASDSELLRPPGPGAWPAIHLAAYFGALDCLRALVAAGADLELRSDNDNANTPLHAAVAGGQPQSVEILVQSGADIHATYHGGTHVLHEACFLGRLDL